MKLIKSVSRCSSIVQSLRFLFNVFIMNSSRFVPVESVYVSKLESLDRAGDVPLSDTVDPWEPSWPNLRRSDRFVYRTTSRLLLFTYTLSSSHNTIIWSTLSTLYYLSPSLLAQWSEVLWTNTMCYNVPGSIEGTKETTPLYYIWKEAILSSYKK